jgi:protein TonB
MPATFRSSLTALLFLLASLSQAQAPPADGEPYRVGDRVTRPEKIAGAPPVYTEEARKAGVTGVVILEAIIDERGDVVNTRVLKGLPKGLDEAALETVTTWKFKPATLDGQPVKVYYTLTVNYTMDPGYGALYWKFLQENPDFAELVRGGKYTEALALLDTRVNGPEVRLARAYVLGELRRLDEAWEEAQAYDGPDPDEIFHYIAFAALIRVGSTAPLDDEARARILEVGLQAATRVLEARENDHRAMLTKSQLLRAKAKLTVDPQRAALLYEASELEKRARSDQ